MNEIECRVDHVQVAAPAGCEAAARRFYGALIGLTEVPKPESMGRGGCWFRAANIEIHIGVMAGFEAATKAHIALCPQSLSALDALAERLEGEGYPVLWDERLPGARRFFSADPWGNRIELLVWTDPAR